MAEPTLQQVFGISATQTATELIISKADLADNTGLTVSAEDRAEALLVALLLQAKQVLSRENFDLNSDQSIAIEKGFERLVTRGINADQFVEIPLSVNLHKPQPEATIDPDDY